MERLSAVFNAASVGISVVDTFGNLIKVNPKVCELFGLTEEELIGKCSRDLSYSPEEDTTWPFYECTIEQKSKTPVRVEKKYKRYNGSQDYWWGDIWISPVYDESSDEVEYFVTVLVDITERKKVREELKASQEHYRSLFENLNTAAAVYKAVNDGEDFIFIDFNKAGEIIEDIPREDLIGKSVLKVFPAVKEFGLFEVFQRVYKTGNAEFMPATEYKDSRIKGHWRENLVYKQPSGEIVALYLDVTERMVAEKALRDSELKYRELVQNANSIILGMDSEAHITFINEFGQSFFGYTEEELVGKSVVGTIVPSVESTGRDLNYLLKEICANPSNFGKNINENMDKNKKRFWVEWTNRAVYTEEGNLKGVFCIGSDITARMEAEQALRDSENKFSLAFNTFPYATSISSVATGNFIDVNTSFTDLLGYTREESIHHTSLGLGIWANPKDRSWVLKKVLSGELVRNKEFQFRKKNGEVLTGLFSAVSIKLKDDIYILASMNDITEKKAMEDELHSSEIRYRRLFEASKDGILILNADTGKIVDVNPFLCNLLNYTRDELLLKNLWDIGLFGDINKSKTMFKELQDKEYIRYEDIQLQKKDGTAAEVEFISNVYLVDHIKVIQCNIRDISARREIERALELSRTALSRIEMAKQQDLLDSARALNAGIAHELRTPLQALLNSTEIAIDQMEVLFPDEKPKDLINIYDLLVDSLHQVDYATAVLDSLARFVKSGSSNDIFTIDVVMELHTIIKTLKYTDPFKWLSDDQFRLVHDSDRFFIKSNRIEFSQVITNLCKNAVEAVPDDNPLIEIIVAGTSSEVTISIVDNGMGIPADKGDKIFEPYFTTKGTMGGNNQGLGLAIVKNTVISYGGNISYTSRPGRTNFKICFPRIYEIEG